jgi:hypothetical protein
MLLVNYAQVSRANGKLAIVPEVGKPANVIGAEIPACNGVVHIVDAVSLSQDLGALSLPRCQHPLLPCMAAASCCSATAPALLLLIELKMNILTPEDLAAIHTSLVSCCRCLCLTSPHSLAPALRQCQPQHQLRHRVVGGSSSCDTCWVGRTGGLLYMGDLPVCRCN